jgi:hypothetical protein
MDSFSLNYLLKDLKNLDKDELFEKMKELYYDNKKQSNKIFDLEAKLNKYQNKIEKKNLKESKAINYDGYNLAWVMAEKIVFILKQNNKPMSTKQIIVELLMREPRLNDLYSEREKTLSNFIYNTVKCGFIVRVDKSIGGGYKYALKGKS